jgi:hypothetical protein
MLYIPRSDSVLEANPTSTRRLSNITHTFMSRFDAGIEGGKKEYVRMGLRNHSSAMSACDLTVPVPPSKSLRGFELFFWAASLEPHGRDDCGGSVHMSVCRYVGPPGRAMYRRIGISDGFGVAQMSMFRCRWQQQNVGKL